MRWNDGFIAVDWGTTNRRAYRIDGTGACTDSIEDDDGVMAIPAGGFPKALGEIFRQLGDLPVLLGGMVGSTRGWVEAPYVSCPAGIDELAARLCWIEPDRIAIVPGLSLLGDGRADVMRGEEIQLFGAVDVELIPATCVVCHPGTHNKWVSMKDGRVADFRTVMTGETFNRLREGGILAEMLTGEVTRGDAFHAGLKRGLKMPALTAELFSVRARVLLGDLAREDAASFASGLLIGLDMSVGLAMASGDGLYIMGGPALTALYAAAALEAGKSIIEVDGASAFIAGALAIARTMK